MGMTLFQEAAQKMRAKGVPEEQIQRRLKTMLDLLQGPETLILRKGDIHANDEDRSALQKDFDTAIADGQQTLPISGTDRPSGLDLGEREERT